MSLSRFALGQVDSWLCTIALLMWHHLIRMLDVRLPSRGRSVIVVKAVAQALLLSLIMV